MYRLLKEIAEMVGYPNCSIKFESEEKDGDLFRMTYRKLMEVNANGLRRAVKGFVVGTVLLLSLQAKGISYCTSFPAGAIARRQEEERREQEKIEQLNKLLNERIEQGKMIEITADKNVKLLIKQRKMVDENENQGISLLEGIAFVAFAGLLAFFPFFIERFFRDKL